MSNMKQTIRCRQCGDPTGPSDCTGQCFEALPEFTCCICDTLTKHQWGNNPYPVKDQGKCCDKCNSLEVIPARLKNI
jgi:hypothetical protein